MTSTSQPGFLTLPGVLKRLLGKECQAVFITKSKPTGQEYIVKVRLPRLTKKSTFFTFRRNYRSSLVTLAISGPDKLLISSVVSGGGPTSQDWAAFAKHDAISP